MSSVWYYKQGGIKHGPVSAEQLKSLARSTQITAADEVWKDGMPEWVSTGQLKGLFQEPDEVQTKNPTLQQSDPGATVDATVIVVPIEPRQRKDSIGKRLKEAGELGSKKAIRAKIASFTLPTAYRHLGIHFETASQFETDFPDLFRQHELLKLEINSLAKERANRKPADGFKSQLKAVTVAVKQRTQAAALEFQLSHILEKLGEGTFHKYGEKCAPGLIVTPITEAKSRIAKLDQEITVLESADSGDFLTPKRILHGGVIGILALVICIWILRPRVTHTAAAGNRTVNGLSRLASNSKMLPSVPYTEVQKDFAQYSDAKNQGDVQAELSSLASAISDCDRMSDRKAGHDLSLACRETRDDLLTSVDKSAAKADAEQVISQAPNDPASAGFYDILALCLMEADSQNVSFSRYAPTTTTAQIIADLKKSIKLNPTGATAVGAHLGLSLEEFYASADGAASAELARAAALSPNDEIIGKLQKARPTLVYWRNTLRVVIAVNSGSSSGTMEQDRQVLRNAAQMIAGSSTVNVDPDAIQCGLAYKNYLEELADLSEETSSNQKLLEAFIRGAAGDPFGVAVEDMQASDKMSQKAKEVQRLFEDTNAILSARYDFSF